MSDAKDTIAGDESATDSAPEAVTTPPEVGPEIAPEPTSAPDEATIFAASPAGPDAPISDATILAAAPVSESVSESAPAAPSPAALAAALEPGTVINNMYRVQHALDQGGMGRVFKGEEIGTGEPVAIKVILPEMADQQKVGAMFRREARTLRQLHHPAIVRYFAYLAPDAQLNLHAIVMGFIEGTKLSDHLKSKGPLNEKQVCSLFSRLADGLKRAHEIGVTHRDLSPDNVMLPDDDIAKAVLIDFGISRSTKLRDVTIGNEFAGKLKYVSPEQLGAFGGDADQRSDVYSLGLLMIAALTGQPPQMGDTIVDAVQRRQAVPDLTGLPPVFGPLLYRMLQPDPAWRLPDMEAVIEGLKSISSGAQTVSQAPQQTTSHPSKFGLQSAPMTQTGLGVRIPSAEAQPVRVAPRVEAKNKTGLMLLLTIAGLGALLVGGALYWWKSNPLGPEVARFDGVLPIASGTPEAFLAARLGAPCRYLTSQTDENGAVDLFGYSVSGAEFGGLAGAWQGRFAFTPNVTETAISEAQCAALNLAQPFLGTARTPIGMTFEARTVTRTQGVVGALEGSFGRQNWLAIVAPNGQVFSLSRQLEPAIGSERRFSFRLPSAQAGVYLILATASDKASVRAGAMTEGMQADVIFPLISKELLADPGGFATVATLTITP